MILLIDTHVFLWAISEESKLSKLAFSSMKRDSGNELALSIASLWEIGLKVHTQKLDLPATPEFFDIHMATLGIRRVLAISPQHIHATLNLPRIHKDPFDRMLAAQCVVEKMTLVTSDKIFRKYPIEVIW
jgi:PIN domain nuclease of toxin-antitoxin system